jgi:hypothetical protein
MFGSDSWKQRFNSSHAARNNHSASVRRATRRNSLLAPSPSSNGDRALAKELVFPTRAGVLGFAVSLLTTKNAAVATADAYLILHQSHEVAELWCLTVYLSSIIRSSMSR